MHEESTDPRTARPTNRISVAALLLPSSPGVSDVPFSILGLSFFSFSNTRTLYQQSSAPSHFRRLHTPIFLLSIPSHLPRFPISPSPPMLLPSSTPPPPILIPNLHLPPSLFPMLQRPLFFTCLEIFSFLYPSPLSLPIVSSPPPPSHTPPILIPIFPSHHQPPNHF